VGVHPDVFITIAFSGIAVLVAVVFLVAVVPRIRREGAQVRRSESTGPGREGISASTSGRRARGRSRHDAAVH
jgi:hypothetical protein